MAAADIERAQNILPVLGYYHAHRLDFINTGIGRIKRARDRVETNFAFDPGLEFTTYCFGIARSNGDQIHSQRPLACSVRYAMAASTPPFRCGTPARSNPISTPARVPASIKSFRLPRWPM